MVEVRVELLTVDDGIVKVALTVDDGIVKVVSLTIDDGMILARIKSISQ